jgi:Flp pilus assembly protein TadG
MILSLWRRIGVMRARRDDISTAGAATVELALIIPVLVLIMLGLLDMGRVFYGAITVVSAARAGVAYGSMSPVHADNIPAMVAAAQADAVDVNGLTFAAAKTCECPSESPPTVSCTLTVCPNAAVDGNVRIYVETTVTGTFSTTLPYPGIPNTISISRTAKMRAQ